MLPVTDDRAQRTEATEDALGAPSPIVFWRTAGGWSKYCPVRNGRCTHTHTHMRGDNGYATDTHSKSDRVEQQGTAMI